MHYQLLVELATYLMCTQARKTRNPFPHTHEGILYVTLRFRDLLNCPEIAPRAQRKDSDNELVRLAFNGSLSSLWKFTHPWFTSVDELIVYPPRKKSRRRRWGRHEPWSSSLGAASWWYCVTLLRVSMWSLKTSHATKPSRWLLIFIWNAPMALDAPLVATARPFTVPVSLCD